MSVVVLIIHVLACVALVLTVLLQTGKGASLGAAFGGSSQTVFGSTGAATFLAKMTTAVAIVFMLTSLGLHLVGATRGPSTVMDQTSTSAPAPVSQEAQPAAPASPTAAAQQDAVPADAKAQSAAPAAESKPAVPAPPDEAGKSGQK